MSITINRKSLLRAVKLAGTISQKWNGAKPILQGIHIDSGKTLTLLSTDLERQLTSQLDFSGNSAFAALPSTVRLHSVLSNEDSEEIVLSYESGKLTIRSETGEYTLQDCGRPENFPRLDAPSDAMMELHREKLLAALQEVRHAALEGESARYALGGVNFEQGDGKLVLVATDGKQLSHVAIEATGVEKSNATFVVPCRAIDTLVSMLRNNDSELVNVALTSQSAVFDVDGDTLLARLVNGRYPTWREAVRPEIAVSIPVSVKALASMVKRASTMTTDDSKAVTLSFSDDSLSAESSAIDVGAAKIKFPVSYDIDPFKVSVDPALLLDGLRVLPPDTDCLFSVSGKPPSYDLVRLSHAAYPGLESVIVPMSKAGEQ